jgi:hypothetical protein
MPTIVPARLNPGQAADSRVSRLSSEKIWLNGAAIRSTRCARSVRPPAAAKTLNTTRYSRALRQLVRRLR